MYYFLGFVDSYQMYFFLFIQQNVFGETVTISGIQSCNAGINPVVHGELN